MKRAVSNRAGSLFQGSKARKEEPDKTKYKIELLELEITRWKDAYEKERLCRQETETKYEYLQKALENVGGDILAMLRHGSRTTDDQPKNGDGLSKTQAKDPSVDDATEKSKLSRRQHHSEDSVTSNDRGMSKREDATLTKRPHERIGVLDLSGELLRINLQLKRSRSCETEIISCKRRDYA